MNVIPVEDIKVKGNNKKSNIEKEQNLTIDNITDDMDIICDNIPENVIEKKTNFLDMYDIFGEIKKLPNKTEQLEKIAETTVQINKTDFLDFVTQAYVKRELSLAAVEINKTLGNGFNFTSDDIEKYIVKNETDLQSLIAVQTDAYSLDVNKEQITINKILNNLTYEDKCAEGLLSSAGALKLAGQYDKAGKLYKDAWDLALKTKQVMGKGVPDIKVHVDKRTTNVMTILQQVANLKYNDKSINKFEKKCIEDGIINTPQKGIDAAWIDA